MNLTDRLGEWVARYSTYGLTHMDWVERGVSFDEYQRYRAAFMKAGLGYLASMLVYAALADRVHGKPWIVAVSLLPFFALAAVVVTWVRYILAWDELQRRIAVEGAAVAALVTLLVMMSLVLEKHTIPVVSPTVPVLVLLGTWVLATPILRRRYQ